MQKITFLYLALIAGLCLEPLPVFAQGQDQSPPKGDAKDAEASPHTGKGASHTSAMIAKGTQQGAVSRDGVSDARISGGSAPGALQSRERTTPDISASSQDVRQTSRSQSSGRQSAALEVQGNRGNQYDGHWFAASTHSDWDRGADHQWRNQDYRWYDGGWLIIDVGSPVVYESAGSTESDVQTSLAQRGYYHGPIDGDIGPGSRRAIARYEGDNGLVVNGRIDEPLLVSLRLE